MELFYSTDFECSGKGRNLLGHGGQQRKAEEYSSAVSVVLSGSEADHCARVLRHKVGDEIFIIDGEGGLYRCCIESVELSKKGEAKVYSKIVEKSVGVGRRNYHLVMAVCPTKNMDRYEWFVEKATELGVDVIVPLISEHSIRTSVKKERLEALVLSATKQSLKSYLPKVEDPVSVSEFLADKRGGNIIKLIAHCEEGNKKTIRQYLAEHSEKCLRVSSSKEHREESQDAINIALMVGPEGDFSKREIELAGDCGFLPVTLGPSRLRVETAALSCVSEIYFGMLQG